MLVFWRIEIGSVGINLCSKLKEQEQTPKYFAIYQIKYGQSHCQKLYLHFYKKANCYFTNQYFYCLQLAKFNFANLLLQIKKADKFLANGINHIKKKIKLKLEVKEPIIKQIIIKMPSQQQAKTNNLPFIQQNKTIKTKDNSQQQQNKLIQQTPQIILNHQDYPKQIQQKQDLLIDVQKDSLLKNQKFYEDILDLDQKDFYNQIINIPNKIYVYNIEKLKFQSFFRCLQNRNSMIANTIRDFQINCWKSKNIRKQLKQIKLMKQNQIVKKKTLIKILKNEKVEFKNETFIVENNEISNQIMENKQMEKKKQDILLYQSVPNTVRETFKQKNNMQSLNPIQNLNIVRIEPQFYCQTLCSQSQKNLNKQTIQCFRQQQISNNNQRFKKFNSSFLLQKFKRIRNLNENNYQEKKELFFSSIGLKLEKDQRDIFNNS